MFQIENILILSTKITHVHRNRVFDENYAALPSPSARQTFPESCRRN